MRINVARIDHYNFFFGFPPIWFITKTTNNWKQDRYNKFRCRKTYNNSHKRQNKNGLNIMGKWDIFFFSIRVMKCAHIYLKFRIGEVIKIWIYKYEIWLERKHWASYSFHFFTSSSLVGLFPVRFRFVCVCVSFWMSTGRKEGAWMKPGSVWNGNFYNNLLFVDWCVESTLSCVHPCLNGIASGIRSARKIRSIYK